MSLKKSISDRESEICVGEGFVLQGEVPPLGQHYSRSDSLHALSLNEALEQPPYTLQ